MIPPPARPRYFWTALLAAHVFVSAGLATETAESVSSLEKDLTPIFQEFCFDCHNDEKQKGDLNLTEFLKSNEVKESHEVWAKISEMLESGEMPPSKKPQPSAEAKRRVLDWIEGQLSQADCLASQDPGRVTLRRLNKIEYQNTVRDLLGVDYYPEDFPNDEVGYGFDNIGDVLSLSPMMMEKILAAAEDIARKTIALKATDKLPESHRRLITEMPQAGQEGEVARRLLRPFLRQAYRRPVTDQEVDRAAGFVDLALKNHGTFLEGMRLAVQAVLSSPQFLFRWELDPRDTATDAVRELNDYEVASRLSYFLWNSMPDAELSTLAESGALRKDTNLVQQVHRMLVSPKTNSFMKSFAEQWLQIRNIGESPFDPKLFPRWNLELLEPMKQESQRFFATVLREDRSILELLDSDFTFLNEKLARFYGIEGVTGDQLQRVQLPPDSPRGGVLTQGAVLLGTSNPNRTSPVLRGKWVLEQILGKSPPPPPPDVPALPEQGSVDQSASLRERLQQHVSNPDCAQCHAKMDPLGLALENFDATGGWRDRDGKFPVDPTGSLPDGRAIQGPRELKKLLQSDPRFPIAFTGKLLTYALGRGLDFKDRCAVKDIVSKASPGGLHFSALVAGIVTSDPFLKRKAAPAAGKTTQTKDHP